MEIKKFKENKKFIDKEIKLYLPKKVQNQNNNKDMNRFYLNSNEKIHSSSQNTQHSYN